MSHFYRIKPLKWEPLGDRGDMIARFPFHLGIRVFCTHETTWYYGSNGTTTGAFKTAEAAMKAAPKLP